MNKPTASACSSDPWSASIAKPPPRPSPAAQIDFVNLIVSELTANGVMDASRLCESPFTDHAPRGPDLVFTNHDLDAIIDTLKKLRAHALPEAAH